MNTKDDGDKKGTILFKLSLYCVSLWILMLMLIVLKIDLSAIDEGISLKNAGRFVNDNRFSLICAVIFIMGFVGYRYFKDSLKNAKKLPVDVEKCESVNYENLSFLATYVIPLVCFPMDSNREIIVLFGVIIIIGCIFVKTNLYYTNPSLVLMGFNIYNVKCKNGEGFENGIVIIRGKLKKNDTISYMSLSDNVYFARKIK